MFSERVRWNLSPNRFSEALAKHRAAGRELLDLTESNPTRVGLDYGPELPGALGGPASLEYAPDPKGRLAARQAVAGYYRQRTPTAELSPEQIVLTASTSEGYAWAFRLLCDAGDEVLVPAPSYPLFDFLARLNDVRLVQYPLIYDHGWQIDLHALVSALTRRSRAVIVVHPNNPTGSYVQAREMDALGDLCSQRGLAIVADEVFFDYALDRQERSGFAGFAPALTLALSGLSKISALPQMKLGWMVVSGEAEMTRGALERLEVVADTYLSVSTPVQLAAGRFLQSRHSIQGQLRERIALNLRELDRLLASVRACRRLEVQGGWYVVIRVPVTRSDEDLAIALLERRSTLLHPGHFYDFPGDGYLVASLITRPEVFREGMARMLEIVT